MNVKNILFISGSLGLGHIKRDLEIAKILRRENPRIDISWLTDDPATIVLKEAGEELLPEADLLTLGNTEVNASAKDYKVNLLKDWYYGTNLQTGWSRNVEVYTKVIERRHFDLIVADEPYDLCIEFVKNPSFLKMWRYMKKFPFVTMFDFIGCDAMTRHPIDIQLVETLNKIWVKVLTFEPPVVDQFIFLGEIEDIPDRKFGSKLPNRRRLAEKYFDFVGYVLSFDPKEYTDKAKVRKVLGYGKEPLVVCSIGGTTTGKPLLDLCAKAYPIIRKEIPDLRMILVCGPRLPPDSVQTTEGVEVKGYIPKLYKHLAAADLSIVMAGGTTTLELTALQQPFLYFPLEQHFEQEIDVAMRCERHKAGIKMKYSKTTPESLAKEVVSNISKKVNYAPIAVDGAQKAAQLISQLL